jgi:hypothetical protein
MKVLNKLITIEVVKEIILMEYWYCWEQLTRMLGVSL